MSGPLCFSEKWLTWLAWFAIGVRHTEMWTCHKIIWLRPRGDRGPQILKTRRTDSPTRPIGR
jgi:hypothetical protein